MVEVAEEVVVEAAQPRRFQVDRLVEVEVVAGHLSEVARELVA